MNHTMLERINMHTTLSLGVLLLSGAAGASTVLYEVQELLADDPAQYGGYGSEVSLDGDTLVVCAPGNDTYGLDAGICWVLTRDWSGAFSEQQVIVGSDIAWFERFGYSATVHGDLMVIGARAKVVDGLVDAGAVYVFERMSGTWQETAILTAPVPQQGAVYGWSVDTDGESIIVGARMTDNELGAAWVYVQDSTGDWEVQGTLMGDIIDEGDQFGFSVAIQGDTALAGAPYVNTCGGNNRCGGVVVFQRDGTTWSQSEMLVPDDIAYEDYFGWDCDLDEEADRIVATSIYDDTNGNQSGCGYIWDLQNGSWVQTAKLLPSDGETQDQCGKQCEIDGDMVVISSWYGNDDKGEAWAWQLNGDAWTEVAMLRASDGGGTDIFGRSVTLDGETAVVGADWHDVVPADDDNAGAAYVYDLAMVSLPTGACCTNGTCIAATSGDCDLFGGTYQGDGADCADFDCGDDCAADVDGDGVVAVDDLLEVIGAWGLCP
ncbi:MAG: FG-GAP repeat protein [Phycisphaerales bacterium]|nr:FG-GAP repeat protein [Phycisphaerales bacterium]